MQTFAEKPKVVAVSAKLATPALWGARQRAELKPESVGRNSLGFDFSFARIAVNAPKRAYDQPIDPKGVTKKIKEEVRVQPAESEEREGVAERTAGLGGGVGLREEHNEGEEVKVASDIGLNLQQKKVDDLSGGVSGGKKDKVASGVTLGSLSQPGNGKVEAGSFGHETYDADFKGVSHSFAKKVCTISGTLDVTCQWGTHSRNRKDVPSGTAPVVTAESWPDIKKDLTPEKDAPYISPRKEYYSKKLTENHEIFHGTDDFDRTTNTGMGLVKTSLEKNTVTPKNADKKIPKFLKDAKAALVSDIENYYEGTGTDHSSYAGEIRAYLKGKPDYEALVDEVEKHGKTLRIRRNTRRR
jgi:hypothetical protein